MREQATGARQLGQVAEWLKAHAWKACGGETHSRVRIPPCPYTPIGRRTIAPDVPSPPGCETPRSAFGATTKGTVEVSAAQGRVRLEQRRPSPSRKSTNCGALAADEEEGDAEYDVNGQQQKSLEPCRFAVLRNAIHRHGDSRDSRQL